VKKNWLKALVDTFENNKNIIPTPKEYIPYCSDDNSSDVKLSIQEKNLLKKYKNNSKSDKQNTNNNNNSNEKVNSFNLLMSD
jgi:hypothetical protein